VTRRPRHAEHRWESPSHAREHRARRGPARIVAGALALGLGLGLGVPAAMALWYDQDEWEALEIQRLQVAFTGARFFDGDEADLDGGDENPATYSMDDEDSPSFGTHLGGPIVSEEELKDAEAGEPIYIKYVLKGQVTGDAVMKYTPGIIPPTDPEAPGVTVSSKFTLYYAGTDAGVECDAAFFSDERDKPLEDWAPRVEYDDGTMTPFLDDLDPIVSAPESEGQQVWCLEFEAQAATYSNTASVTVDTKVGKKSASDDWATTISRSIDAADQLQLWFTPSVTRGSS
jgi:hypothetical protein